MQNTRCSRGGLQFQPSKPRTTLPLKNHTARETGKWGAPTSGKLQLSHFLHPKSRLGFPPQTTRKPARVFTKSEDKTQLAFYKESSGWSQQALKRGSRSPSGGMWEVAGVGAGHSRDTIYLLVQLLQLLPCWLSTPSPQKRIKKN
jgi:hypothetical protein